MLDASLISRHSACLQRLAERTEAVLEGVFVRLMAAEGQDLNLQTEQFCDLGRALRLTLALEMRLMTLKPAVQGFVPFAEVPSHAIAPVEIERLTLRSERPERERERETESDGYPSTALGRAEALEGLITRRPALDPDGRVSAEIIQIKAFLSEPPEPETPEPPPGVGHSQIAPSQSSPSQPTRPLNRAERRRLRRGSG